MITKLVWLERVLLILVRSMPVSIWHSLLVRKEREKTFSSTRKWPKFRLWAHFASWNMRSTTSIPIFFMAVLVLSLAMLLPCPESSTYLHVTQKGHFFTLFPLSLIQQPSLTHSHTITLFLSLVPTHCHPNHLCRSLLAFTRWDQKSEKIIKIALFWPLA